VFSLSDLNSFSNDGVVFNDQRPMTITFSNDPAVDTTATGFNSNLTMPINTVGTNITSLSSANNVSYSVNLSSFSGATLTWVDPLPGVTTASYNSNVYTISNIVTVDDWESIRYVSLTYPAPINAINFGNNFSITSNITYANTAIGWTTRGIIPGPTHIYVKNTPLSLWYNGTAPVISASDGATYSFQLTLGSNVGYIANGTVTSPPAEWTYGNLTYNYSGTVSQCNGVLANIKIYPHTDVITTTTLQYRQQRNSVSQVNNTVTLVGQIAQVPDAPSSVTATNGNGQSSVSFVPGPNGGDAINYFTILSTPGGITATGTSSPITITGLTNGTNYTFQVKANNDIGDSPYSSPSNNVLLGSPDAPTSISASYGNTQATVSFTAPFNYGSTITNYTVTANVGNITATGNSSPITVTGLTNGTPYKFKVTATNINGTSADSQWSNTVVPKTVPGAPTDLYASNSGNNAVISFTAPSDLGGDIGISNYQAISTPGNITANLGQSPITVTGLTVGTSYTFKIKATNSVGYGALSTASNSVIAGAPGIPSINRATATGNTTVIMSFTAPTSTGSSSISSYTVIDQNNNIVATTTSSPVTINSLTQGNNYQFRIRANNSAGAGLYSNPSNQVTPGQSIAVEYLVVGGGGAGGAGSKGVSGTGVSGGGGSGGRALTGTFNLFPLTNYSGFSGTGGVNIGSLTQEAQDSSFNGVTAGKGQRGQNYSSRSGTGSSGSANGSGGGGGWFLSGTRSPAGGGWGNNGTLPATNGGYGATYAGGGGGGSGGNGANGSGTVPGAGGNAYYSTITGSNTGYGGGGSGGILTEGNSPSAAGYGNAANGAGAKNPNTTYYGGNGAPGVVIIRYPATYNAVISAGTASTTTVGEYKVTTFNLGSFTVSFE
jgi:hypothetical protein